MVCEHLRDVEAAVRATGARELHRGQVWTEAGEWVYFDAVLDVDALLALRGGDALEVHANLDQRSGTERGLVCPIHRDGVMGRLPGHG